MGVAENMRVAREALSLTQRDVADYLGVTTAMVAKYESGSTLSFERAERLADFLSISLDELRRGIPPAWELKRRHYTRLLRELEAEALAVSRPSDARSRRPHDTEETPIVVAPRRRARPSDPLSSRVFAGVP